MTTSNFDLLRERRAQLGEPEPDFSNPLRPLVQGTIFGSLFFGITLIATGLVFVAGRATSDEIRNLSGIQTRFNALQERIVKDRTTRSAVEKQANDLVRAFLSIQSGSALLEDLRRRAPKGVQFTEIKVDSNQNSRVNVKGLAYEPNAFARINVLQLELKRSLLFIPDQVVIIKSNRDQQGAQNNSGPTNVGQAPPVVFELTASLRSNSTPNLLSLFRSLGSEGMAVRLQKLQKEGFF
jgi:type IV pilus assembly protein PilN